MNNLIIGNYAGSHLTDEEGIVIIGDNIRDLKPENNKNVLFLKDKVAIGETIGGVKINLKEVLLNFIKEQSKE